MTLHSGMITITESVETLAKLVHKFCDDQVSGGSNWNNKAINATFDMTKPSREIRRKVNTIVADLGVGNNPACLREASRAVVTTAFRKMSTTKKRYTLSLSNALKRQSALEARRDAVEAAVDVSVERGVQSLLLKTLNSLSGTDTPVVRMISRSSKPRKAIKGSKPAAINNWSQKYPKDIVRMAVVAPTNYPVNTCKAMVEETVGTSPEKVSSPVTAS
jgi:hypothetical protein